MDQTANLKSTLSKHNIDLLNRCEARRKAGRCDPYLCRRMTCSDCPRDESIDL